MIYRVFSPGQDEQRKLLGHARSGQGDAIDRVIEHCRPSLNAYLESRVGPGLRRYASVSDLEQEVLMRMPELLARLAQDACMDDLLGLVLQNARWVIHNTVRSGQRFAGESVIDAGAARGERSATHGSVTRADETDHLKALLANIEPKLAEVVKLRLEERSFTSIAQELGIAEATVRKRYMAAARELRHSWGN